jgi:Tol biopolymer transport system component
MKSDHGKGSHDDIGIAIVFVTLLVTSPLVVSINPVQTASAATFPRINGKIAFTSNYEIYVMNADGSKLTKITNSISTSDYDPSWSPDGTKIAFTRLDKTDFSFNIYLMNADGSRVAELIGNNARNPSWSPDGTKIAFVESRGTNKGIYTANAADGSGITQLTNGKGDDEPSWAPNGSKIAFSSLRDGSGLQVYVMNADGSEITKLTDKGGYSPSWSPDGSKIIFLTSRDYPLLYDFLPRGNSIYTMNADGAGQTSLYAGERSFEAGRPNYSPDCTKIVFSVRFFENGPYVYTMNADGAGQPTSLKMGYGVDWGRADAPPISSQHSTLTVNAVSQNDGQILHMPAKILSTDGTVLKSGFTPMNFTGNIGKTYTISVANYLARDFNHWENNSTDITRTIDLSSSGTSVITAFYDTSFSKSGYTPLTYSSNATGKPALTVNATSLGSSDDNNSLHMWTIIKLEDMNRVAANNSSATYVVAASNYGDKVFDHWNDGSTDRIRTLGISKDTTIIAYYRTG